MCRTRGSHARDWLDWSSRCLLASPVPGRAQTAPLFRLFLTNGKVVTCLGDTARVGDRVVFTMPVGDSSQLLSLPQTLVDWARTEQYTDSFRAARYAETRGEADFSALAGQVAAVLNEIAITNDPGRKLQLALDARRRLEAWPRDHYNYKAGDVRQIVQLVDEAISEMRAAAGEQQFDFSFEANVQPAEVPVLPEPTVAESLTSAAAVVDLTDDPSERMSLLESLAQAIDKATASLSSDVATHLQTLVHDRLRGERQVEADYSRLSSFAGADAKTPRGARRRTGCRESHRARAGRGRTTRPPAARTRGGAAGVGPGRARLGSPASAGARSVVGEDRHVSQLPSRGVGAAGVARPDGVAASTTSSGWPAPRRRSLPGLLERVTLVLPALALHRAAVGPGVGPHVD